MAEAQKTVEQAEELLGPEEVESLTTLFELDEQVDEAEAKNEALFTETREKYDAVIDAIIEKLRIVSGPQKREYVALKNDVALRKKAFEAKFPELLEAERDKKAKKKFEQKAKPILDLLDSTPQISEEEADEFKRAWRQLPHFLKIGYLNLLKGALNESNPVLVLTKFRAVLWELSRRALLEDQGLERIEDYDKPIVVPYFGYDKKDPRFDKPPAKRLGGHKKGDIQFDIQAIMRDGKPRVLETKFYSRKAYGADYGDGEAVSARNQLLKYQKAIEDGQIEGATLEISGRIDRELLIWAIGEDISEEGATPDVEIIYNFPLPSGREFRFVLKGGKGKGLRFENEKSDYTIDDIIVIRGLAYALRDKSISAILHDVGIDPDTDHPLVTREHIEEPTTIDDPDVFEAYDDLRKKTIWAKLEAKAINPPEIDKISAYDERATEEFVMKILVDFQEMLNANPELKAIKWAYVVEEDQYEEVVGKVMAEVAKIKEYEVTRQRSIEERRERVIRDIKGYEGPVEGYPLDVEHILMDVLQNVTKTGEDQKPRSYDDVSRFIELPELREHLTDKDRVYIEVTTYDPLADRFGSTIITGSRRASEKEKLLEEHEKRLVTENLKRAEGRLNKLLKKYKTLHEIRWGSWESMDDTQKAEYADLQSQLSGYNAGLNSRLEKAKSDLEEVNQAKSDELRPLQQRMRNLRNESAERGMSIPELREEIVAGMTAISARFAQVIEERRQELLGIYAEIFRKDWDSFAFREVSREEANLMKLIYAVTPEGTVSVEEERIRGGADSSRAAHSELAQGRNVYAAGELAFERGADGVWRLTEINNGSGHYRPGQDTLNYAKEIITEQLGLDPEDPSIELVNCIFRGINIEGIPTRYRK